LPRKEKRS